jgi:hypothetical protein
MVPPAGGVAVRMYRQGLGDCFLLAFPRPQAGPFYMLIDCGVIVGQGPNRPGISAVVHDIANATDRHLDLVVATHQHWDHLSGFVDARTEFAEMQIDHVWLAWTEDPSDPVGKQLRHHATALRATLRAASARVAAPPYEEAAATAAVPWATSFASVLDFFGADAGPRSTAAALTSLTSLCANDPQYCQPDQPPRILDGVDDVRVYVLGPPRDIKKIKRYNDRTADPETYRLTDAALAAEAAFLAAALGDAVAGDESLRMPFDACEQITRGRDPKRFAALDRDAFGPGDAWRTVTVDWLRAATRLALQLDNATNNTSLALAIELGPQGKVLLFPGDAQVGNWLSWHDQTWTDGAGHSVSAADLLKRTVLYKVGHHASHNATLRQRGLELMTSEDLVALVPLDRKTAIAKGWVMPWPALRRSLATATKGRILQVDDTTVPAARSRPQDISPADWQAFVSSVVSTNLYFEVKVSR